MGQPAEAGGSLPPSCRPLKASPFSRNLNSLWLANRSRKRGRAKMAKGLQKRNQK